MKLSSIHIYPIKSCKGIALESSEVLLKGLKYDRRWMLVDEFGEAITQREFPQLSQIEVALTDSGLVVHTLTQGKCVWDFETTPLGTISVRIWDDTVLAEHFTHPINEWFSEMLKTKCKLVYLPENGIRIVDQKYAVSPQDQVSFADGYPLLVISEASLEALNERLIANGAQPVPMNRFRPNLVISGCEPFAEDTWQQQSQSLQIGDITFALVKPCARCMIPTIDQETGVGSKEPLKTLATFRTQNQKVLFGQNSIPLQEGYISLSNLIKISE